MRILLLTHFWTPEIGAPQRRWQWLARGLAERGHELAVLAPAPHYPAGALLPQADADAHLRPGGRHRDGSGAVVHRTAFRPYGTGLSGRAADWAVAAADALRLGAWRFRGTARPDVIIASVPSLTLLPAAVCLGHLLDRPVVAEMRDAWPDILASSTQWAGGESSHAAQAGLATAVLTRHGADTAPGSSSRLRAGLTHGGRTAARRATWRALTAMQRHADAVVTTTDTFAQRLREHGVQRVVAVRNTAGTRTWDLPAVPARREDGSLHVLYLGTVGRAQGLEVAAQAADLAARAGTHVILRVVGDGAGLGAFRRTAESLGAPVEILPPVAPSRIGEQYAWADSVLVCLQDWPSMELTVPSKLYEAMGTGRHVSAAVAGEAASIVRASGAGDVVAPQDPGALAGLWERLAAERVLLDRGGRGASWLAEHAEPGDMVDRLVALLEEVRRA